MPEKITGVFGILKNVFKSKKENHGDIVYQAETVIRNYIDIRRGDIINKHKRKNKLMNFLLLFFSGLIMFMVYRLLI